MTPEEQSQFDDLQKKFNDMQSALAEVNRRISTQTKPLVDYLNAHKGGPGFAEAAEAWKWAVYASAVHCQISLAGSRITSTDRGLIQTPLLEPLPDYQQLYNTALEVMLNTQQMAGCDGLDEVIRRAKAYQEMSQVINRCVRLADLMMAGYTADTGNELLARCEKDAGDAAL